MKTLRTFSPILCCIGLLTAMVGEANAASLDAEGYIRDWVMLAPIPLRDGETCEEALLKDQIKGESTLRPKAGDKAMAGGKELTWQHIIASTNYFDFNATLKTINDHAAGYAVTYIECDKDIPDVVMAVAGNDQGRIYFNGVDIYAFTEARTLMLDADKGKVTLKKGVNVIVFKVLNEQNSWQCAMRLLTRSGMPLKDVKIRLSP